MSNEIKRCEGSPKLETTLQNAACPSREYFYYDPYVHTKRNAVISLLLEHGADQSQPLMEGTTTVLHEIAAINGLLEPMLVDGVDLEQKDSVGRTPLMKSCSLPNPHERVFETVRIPRANPSRRLHQHHRLHRLYGPALRNQIPPPPHNQQTPLKWRPRQHQRQHRHHTPLPRPRIFQLPRNHRSVIRWCQPARPCTRWPHPAALPRYPLHPAQRPGPQRWRAGIPGRIRRIQKTLRSLHRSRLFLRSAR
jgi:hypothetical protein